MVTGPNAFGPTGDRLVDAMRAAVRLGAARLSEMGLTGFTTDTPFDNVCQPEYVGEGRRPFILVSLDTNTSYFVLVTGQVGANLRVAVAVYQEGQTPKTEHLRMMTLKRGQDGNTHATPGW